VPAEIQYIVQRVSPSAGASPNIPQFESILQGALLVLFLMVLPGGLAAGWRFRSRRAAARPAEGALAASGQRDVPARSVTAQVISGMGAWRRTPRRRVIELDPKSPLLSVADLVVGYPGAGLALHGVSLELHAGEVIAVVGPNGAGKTTLVRALSGFTSEERGFVRSGTIRLGGHDVTRSSAFQRARNGITLIPEREKVFSDLTVYENLYVSAGRNAHASIDRVLEGFPALTSKLARKAVLLSGGERHMLALARALILNPKVLLVDETTLGLAPKAAGDAMAQLREVARLYDTGVILVEQNVQLALDHSDRYYVLNRGLIVSAASSTEGARESVDAFMGASI
jgi:branched-chain amino acid transport system ATP-binding protein